MEFKILNFNKIERELKNIYTSGNLTVADYWQWYTTGIEKIVNDQDFIITDRYNNERSDILAYNFYENESLADLLILINNDNFIWDTPGDYDLLWDITDNKMNYLRNLNKVDFTQEEIIYWREKMEKKTEEVHQIQSNIVIPKRGSLQKIIRTINNYLENREVK